MENKILVETSARHVHLTTEAVEALFGKGYKLTVKKPLSQPSAASSPFRGAYSYRFSTGTSFGHPFRGGFFVL